jgi:hypothetical protein
MITSAALWGQLVYICAREGDRLTLADSLAAARFPSTSAIRHFRLVNGVHMMICGLYSPTDEYGAPSQNSCVAGGSKERLSSHELVSEDALMSSHMLANAPSLDALTFSTKSINRGRPSGLSAGDRIVCPCGRIRHLPRSR